jgi:hypothetical protein
MNSDATHTSRDMAALAVHSAARSLHSSKVISLAWQKSSPNSSRSAHQGQWFLNIHNKPEPMRMAFQCNAWLLADRRSRPPPAKLQEIRLGLSPPHNTNKL